MGLDAPGPREFSAGPQDPVYTQPMRRSRSFFRPLDALIILTVLVASVWGFLAFRMEAGASVQVFLGNKKYGWYPVSGEIHSVTIPTKIGPVLLELGAGGARIVSSPCRNKVCVRTGRIGHSHSEIICMPAQLLVIMTGSADDGSGKPSGSGAKESAGGSGNGADAVTY